MNPITQMRLATAMEMAAVVHMDVWLACRAVSIWDVMGSQCGTMISSVVVLVFPRE